jgi:ribosome-associated protein
MERLAGRLVDGVLTVTASEHRRRLHNRRAAETRLVALLADATAAPPRRRRPTRPSRGAVRPGSTPSSGADVLRSCAAT